MSPVTVASSVHHVKLQFSSVFELYELVLPHATKINIISVCVVNVDSRGQLTVWRLRSMVRTTGDAFHYFEAESKQGNIKLDVGEFLCMMVPGTEEVKGVAIVYHQDRFQAPLLRTRLPWDFSLDEVSSLPTEGFQQFGSDAPLFVQGMEHAPDM